ncbi:MAG: serine hydrolase, partial [Planctomycetaceae bacterium]
MGGRQTRWWWRSWPARTSRGRGAAGQAMPGVMLVAGVMLLVAGPSAAAPVVAADVDDRLREAIQPLLAAHEGVVTAAVRQLGTKASFASAADRQMPLASLVKVPVMVAAYAAAHEGRVRLDETVSFTADDVVPGSAVIDKLSPGAEFTLRDAIRMMIASSDNTATNIVIERIGLPFTNEVLDRVGLQGIRLNSYVFRRETSLDTARSHEYGLGNGSAAELVTLMGMIHGRDLER